MDEQPERGEIREAVSLKNLPEVRLDVGGAGAGERRRPSTASSGAA
jgi:hypothetical protein